MKSQGLKSYAFSVAMVAVVALAPLGQPLRAVPSEPTLGSLPSPSEAKSAGNDPTDGHPIFSLGLNWNESVHIASVAVPNTAGQAVNVLGVQGSSGVYLTSIPNVLPAKGTAEVGYILVTDSSGETSSDFLKVLTSQGTIVVEIQHDRAVAAQFSTQSLQWSVGGSADPKTVTLTMTPGTAVPIGIVALGTGNKATISGGSNGQYTITVTPGSTSKAETFPVEVTFNPRLPGVTGVIGCTVQ